MRTLALLALVAFGAATLSAGCGAPPPQPGPLLQRTSQHMNDLKSFHFVMEAQGDQSQPPPVQGAEGDAQPPDLSARATLRQGQVLLEINLIYARNRIFLKSFTGGWQAIGAEAVAQFFDVRALFDRENGLFAALPETREASVGKQETIDSHKTYPVSGRLAASRVHRILPTALDQGDYVATYWIESKADTLWRARVSGTLFDPRHAATLTLTFSRLNEPVSITPPPVS